MSSDLSGKSQLSDSLSIPLFQRGMTKGKLNSLALHVVSPGDWSAGSEKARMTWYGLRRVPGEAPTSVTHRRIVPRVTEAGGLSWFATHSVG